MDRKLFMQGLLLLTLAAAVAHAESPVTETPSAPAASTAVDDVEDLSMQAESDRLDVYDQKQMEVEAKKETKELETQSRNLEHEIDQLSRQSKELSQKIKSQSMTYAQAAGHFKQLSHETHQMQSKRNQLKAQVEQLANKVSKLTSKISAAKEEKNRLAREVREQDRSKAHLTTRKKQAEATLERQNKENAKLRQKLHG